MDHLKSKLEIRTGPETKQDNEMKEKQKEIREESESESELDEPTNNGIF
jgi:hypothetical protein